MSAFDLTNTPIPRRPPTARVPLTPAQRAVWNDGAQPRMSDLRTCAINVRVVGPLDTTLLRESVEAVFLSHEALRTRIVDRDGEPEQCVDTIHSSNDVFEVVDLTTIEPSKAGATALQLGQSFADQEIDLSRGPLFQAKLYRLSQHEHIFLAGIDHLISDATSFGILNREIWSVYGKAAGGTSLDLPVLDVHFPDYVIWRESTFYRWCQNHGPYWKNRLAGAPSTELPADDPHAVDEPGPSGSTAHLPFGKVLSDELRELAIREKTLLPVVVAAIYAAVMANWCEQDDLIMEFESHARAGRPELDNVIGHIATPLYLRIQLDGVVRPIDVIKQVDEEFQSARTHQPHGVGVLGLFSQSKTDVIFNWITTNWLRRSAIPDLKDSNLKMQLFPIQPRATFRRIEAPSILKASFSDSASGVVAIMKYRTSRFTPATLDRLARDLRILGHAFANCTNQPLASITRRL